MPTSLSAPEPAPADAALRSSIDKGRVYHALLGSDLGLPIYNDDWDQPLPESAHRIAGHSKADNFVVQVQTLFNRMKDARIQLLLKLLYGFNLLANCDDPGSTYQALKVILDEISFKPEQRSRLVREIIIVHHLYSKGQALVQFCHSGNPAPKTIANTIDNKFLRKHHDNLDRLIKALHEQNTADTRVTEAVIRKARDAVLGKPHVPTETEEDRLQRQLDEYASRAAALQKAEDDFKLRVATWEAEHAPRPKPNRPPGSRSKPRPKPDPTPEPEPRPDSQPAWPSNLSWDQLRQLAKDQANVIDRLKVKERDLTTRLGRAQKRPPRPDIEEDLSAKLANSRLSDDGWNDYTERQPLSQRLEHLALQHPEPLRSTIHEHVRAAVDCETQAMLYMNSPVPRDNLDKVRELYRTARDEVWAVQDLIDDNLGVEYTSSIIEMFFAKLDLLYRFKGRHIVRARRSVVPDPDRHDMEVDQDHKDSDSDDQDNEDRVSEDRANQDNEDQENEDQENEDQDNQDSAEQDSDDQISQVSDDQDGDDQDGDDQDSADQDSADQDSDDQVSKVSDDSDNERKETVVISKRRQAA